MNFSADQTTQSATIGSSNDVTFDLGGFTYKSGTLAVGGGDGDTSTLQVQNGVLDTTGGDSSTLILGSTSTTGSGNLALGSKGAVMASGVSVARGKLDVDDGGTCTVSSAMQLETTGSVNLNGGTLTAGTISGSGTFTFTKGTLALTAGGAALGGLLPGSFTVDASKALTVSGTLSAGASGNSLTLDGGTLSAGAIDTTGGGTFTINKGSLALTAGGATLGELLPNNITLDANHVQALTVSGTLSTGAGGNSLTLNGGSLSAGAIDTSGGGALTFTKGSLAVTASDVGIGAGGLFNSLTLQGAPKAPMSLSVTQAVTLTSSLRSMRTGHFKRGRST